MADRIVWLSPAQVSELTGMTIDQLAQWRHRKIGFPFYKPSPRRVLYDEAEVVAYIRDKRIETKEAAA